MTSDIQKSSNIEPVIVTIELDRDFFSEELQIISKINKKISSAEISLSPDGRSLNAFLFKLDPDHFQKVIDELILLSGLNERYQNELNNPFHLLIQKIFSIKSYGIRYRKRVYAGYADERKVIGRKEKSSDRGSFFYANNNSFSSNINQLPAEYMNKVLCGDSEVVLSTLPDNCIDIIITSPPYNFGLEYSSSGDSKKWDQYLEKLYCVFSEGIRVLKYGGRFIVNVQPLFSDYIPLHHLLSNFFMNNKMIWKGEILWEKNNYNCKYTSWGSWKSPSSPYLKYTWEFIEIFCKGTLKKPGKSENADISDEEFKSWVVAKWSMGPERRMKQFNHPAMFPEELVERCLKLFSFKGDIVLDPFNGAGTSTLVAAKTGRNYLGIDISSEYCEIARDRISGLTTKNSSNDDKAIKKSNNKNINPEAEIIKKRRGRPSKQKILKSESSQHHLDGFYSV